MSRYREVSQSNTPHGQSSFIRFVETHLPTLQTSLKRSLRKRYQLRYNEADDVIQDVMIKMQTIYSTLKNPEAWAFRTADNEACNYLRRRQRHSRALSRLGEMPGTATTRTDDQHRTDDDLRERFLRILPKLTRRERKLWELLATTPPGRIRPYNQREIAELWGMTHNSVRQLTSALYKKIRSLAGT